MKHRKAGKLLSAVAALALVATAGFSPLAVSAVEAKDSPVFKNINIKSEDLLGFRDRQNVNMSYLNPSEDFVEYSIGSFAEGAEGRNNFHYRIDGDESRIISEQRLDDLYHEAGGKEDKHVFTYLFAPDGNIIAIANEAVLGGGEIPEHELIRMDYADYKAGTAKMKIVPIAKLGAFSSEGSVLVSENNDVYIRYRIDVPYGDVEEPCYQIYRIAADADKAELIYTEHSDQAQEEIASFLIGDTLHYFVVVRNDPATIMGEEYKIPEATAQLEWLSVSTDGSKHSNDGAPAPLFGEDFDEYRIMKVLGLERRTGADGEEFVISYVARDKSGKCKVNVAVISVSKDASSLSQRIVSSFDLKADDDKYVYDINAVHLSPDYKQLLVVTHVHDAKSYNYDGGAEEGKTHLTLVNAYDPSEYQDEVLSAWTKDGSKDSDAVLADRSMDVRMKSTSDGANYIAITSIDWSGSASIDAEFQTSTYRFEYVQGDWKNLPVTPSKDESKKDDKKKGELNYLPFAIGGIVILIVVIVVLLVISSKKKGGKNKTATETPVIRPAMEQNEDRPNPFLDNNNAEANSESDSDAENAAPKDSLVEANQEPEHFDPIADAANDPVQADVDNFINDFDDSSSTVEAMTPVDEVKQEEGAVNPEEPIAVDFSEDALSQDSDIETSAGDDEPKNEA